MEVHAHPHTERKKFTHYLWEFLMLFLAVFCGFLAENQREHFVEKKREREYIRAMIYDLKTDANYFTNETKIRKKNRAMMDSLINLLSQKSRTEFEQQRMYYFARYCIAIIELPQIHDRTYDQMKSSGNLRLIQKKKIADSISNYYFNAKEIKVNTDQTVIRIINTIDFEGKIFDGTVFEKILDKDNFVFTQPSGYPELITKDKTLINELIVRLHYLISISAFTEAYFKRMNADAIRLISFLESEYHLD